MPLFSHDLKGPVWWNKDAGMSPAGRTWEGKMLLAPVTECPRRRKETHVCQPPPSVARPLPTH